ncbi:MAG: TMEM175 family protein [Bdellovibrionales bacterium]|nr:TMEM175 family protein [Bdellovibrionales bacterium]
MQDSTQAHRQMSKGRLEAFSDGVLAIIITIMILEIKVPHDAELSSLFPLIPTFFSYILSFIYVGIYWSNHHHLFQLVKHVNGPVLWANNHLLFWLSMLPFVTAWSGENHFAGIPVAAYGAVLFLCSIAYYILIKTLIATHGKDSEIATAIGRDTKGKVSSLLCAVAIPIACFFPYISLGLYAVVAAMWIVPDKRVENVLQ